ncbi:hypothetical protein HPB47_009380 [Ixodes persulcatus]|uniref:Uncharacterized protein n=1 Tax=Ixodes persulcatus TaxID=34615 RepID=A0AC60P217_IXOPE|nr:hypothetical protein HPB47_009380 [Ixodes persulcatus]
MILLDDFGNGPENLYCPAKKEYDALWPRTPGGLHVVRSCPRSVTEMINRLAGISSGIKTHSDLKYVATAIDEIVDARIKLIPEHERGNKTRDIADSVVTAINGAMEKETMWNAVAQEERLITAFGMMNVLETVVFQMLEYQPANDATSAFNISNKYLRVEATKVTANRLRKPVMLPSNQSNNSLKLPANFLSGNHGNVSILFAEYTNVYDILHPPHERCKGDPHREQNRRPPRSRLRSWQWLFSPQPPSSGSSFLRFLEGAHQLLLDHGTGREPLCLSPLRGPPPGRSESLAPTHGREPRPRSGIAPLLQQLRGRDGWSWATLSPAPPLLPFRVRAVVAGEFGPVPRHFPDLYNKPRLKRWREAKWKNDGCRVKSATTDEVVCSCDHLTNFAVLMSPTASLEDDDGLHWITVISCLVSIACLALCIAVFSFYRHLKGIRNTIHRNLCVSLLIGEIILLLGLDKDSPFVKSPGVCTTVALLLHFFFLSAFAWMALEGCNIIVLLWKVFNQKRTYYERYYIAGYDFFEVKSVRHVVVQDNLVSIHAVFNFLTSCSCA